MPRRLVGAFSAAALLAVIAIVAVTTDGEEGPDREDAGTSERVTPSQAAETTTDSPDDSREKPRPKGTGQIEGYADAVSVLPGEWVTLMVSTEAPRFRVQAFRIGWYDGGYATKVWASDWLPGGVQRAPSFQPVETRTIVAKWKPSIRVRTDGWKPGGYLFKLVSATGWSAHIPLIVRSPDAVGKVALVAPVTTWQSYNYWGDYSLYRGPEGDRRAWAVSYDRPYPPPGSGPGANMYGFLPVAVRAERVGVPLAYFTNIDVHADPEALRGAHGYVSVGHDEYWTIEMRRHVTAARDAGTNLAFLGANTMYWRILLEDRATGPDRLQVGWRSDAALDPAAAADPSLSTARWRDPPRSEPENSLIGMQYECYPADAPYRIVTPSWWGFRDTGVRRGTSFHLLVGNESDRVYPIPSTPRPLQILASAPYSCRGVDTSGQSTYYTTESGAGVFTAGTLRWSCALTRHCDVGTMSVSTQRFVSTVTQNVVREFSKGPVGIRYPARDNVAGFDLPSTNQVPAS
jgi:hypothetical protein